MTERNERQFDQVARECAEAFNGLTGPAQTLLIWHIVRASMGKKQGNFLAEQAKRFDVTEDAATYFGEAYNVLLEGHLLECTGKVVDVKIFGQPDREEDVYRLGPNADVLFDFIKPPRPKAKRRK